MGLKSKGETVEEIAGIVRALKENTVRFKKDIRMFWIIAELAVMDHRVLISAPPLLLSLQVQEFRLENMETEAFQVKQEVQMS